MRLDSRWFGHEPCGHCGTTSVRKEKVTEMKYLIYVVLKVHDDLHKSPKGQKASSSPPLEAETFIKNTPKPAFV